MSKYVSRGGDKLESVARKMAVDFRGKVVLDVGSSTGGFTDYALRRGAKKVIAVDKGTRQMHPKLGADPKVELHEKTDIRDFELDSTPDIILIDVSFVSLQQVLPHISRLMAHESELIAMVKPQFEARPDQLNKGVVKNERIRRLILTDFETWAKRFFIIKSKADSLVEGSKGNRERFYKIMLSSR